MVISSQEGFIFTLWLLVRQEAFDLRGADRNKLVPSPNLTLLMSHYLTVNDLTEYEQTAGPIATSYFLTLL